MHVQQNLRFARKRKSFKKRTNSIHGVTSLEPKPNALDVLLSRTTFDVRFNGDGS